MEEQPSHGRALQLLEALSEVMAKVGIAVTQGDLAALEGLLPMEESLLREMGGITLPEPLPKEVVQEIEALSAKVFQRNTENSILITEQLALINATVKALLGDRSAVDRLV